GREGLDRLVARMDRFDHRLRPVDRQHLRALLGEKPRGGLPDSRGGARHDRDLSGQSAHGGLRAVQATSMMTLPVALRDSRAFMASAAFSSGKRMEMCGFSLPSPYQA